MGRTAKRTLMGSSIPELFLVFGFLEFRRIAEPQNLSARMARENAVWPFGFERDNSNIPGASTVRRRHAAARQPFERFELEDGACRPHGTERCRWD